MTLSCPLCEDGPSFDRFSSLIAHLDAQHDGWNKCVEMPCPFCTYSSDKGLRGVSRHANRVHPEEDTGENEILFILAKVQKRRKNRQKK